jgi:tellurite resistance protein TerC
MELLSSHLLGVPAWFWLVFLGTVLGVVLFDLGYLHRRAETIGLKQSAAMTVFVATLALLFCGFVWYELGIDNAQLFLTAWILEQSLSIDNVFVIAVIFSYFAVPAQHQHRVLFWGILMAMLLRALFIGAGTAIVTHFEWIMWGFAIFLIYSGYKMFVEADTEPDIGNNSFVKFLARHLNVTTEMHGEKFFLRKKDGFGKSVLYATPVFLAFMTINFADIVFAVDSVPAVLSLTQDPFIVYTSNIFAILGLRSLYFVINALLAMFHYLEHALSVLLVFIGGKIIWDHIFSPVSPGITLTVTVAILATAIVASIVHKKEEAGK